MFYTNVNRFIACCNFGAIPLISFSSWGSKDRARGYTLSLMSLWAVMFGFRLIHGPQNKYFLTPWSCLIKTFAKLWSAIYLSGLKDLCGAFLNSPSLNNHTVTGVFCVKASRGEDLREWSISLNLISCIPPPLITMPLCAAPAALTPTPPHPPLAHMWDAVVLSCSPTAGASPSAPLHPSAFPPFNPNNASVLPATLCRLFQRTSKKEKQIEAAGDNETAG